MFRENPLICGTDTSKRKQRKNRREAVQTQTPNTRTVGLALIAILLLALQPTTQASGSAPPALAGSGEFQKNTSHLGAAKGGPGDIDFESDAGQNQSNGFVSADDSRAAFFDSLGEHLQIDMYGPWSDGQGLRIGGNDPSHLIIFFAEPMASLSLDFGNDQPSLSNPGDEAVLELFGSNNPIGQVAVTLNRNGDMDQTIAYSGECFDSATFIFDVSTPGAAEIVDNIQFEVCGEVVGPPQPIPAVFEEGLVVLVIMVLVLGWHYWPGDPAAHK